MPELPEVEVTRRRIEPHLVGRRIARVHAGRPSYVFLTPPGRLRRVLPGRCVRRLERWGKYLVATLDDRSRLVLHLGMSGRLLCLARAGRKRRRPARHAAADGPGDLWPHTHLRIEFADGDPELWFHDTRKFGKVLWLPPGGCSPRLDRLGTDALDVTAERLYRNTRGRRTAVKNFLLDQSCVAGVGNIYADEALFEAGIRPTRRAGRLTRRECERLAEALRAVLERAIEAGGSSLRDFVAPDGKLGGYQRERRVYGRGGKPCPRCGAALRRIRLGQRAAHFCPRCQR